MRFRDRVDAGERLGAALIAYSSPTPTVLGLPRGGAIVAAEVAKALAAPLDLLLVRKIGVPSQPELAMGAVAEAERPLVVRNEDIITGCGVSEDEFRSACAKALEELERRRRAYVGDGPRAPVAGRVVIVVDDGVATGATTRAALRTLRLAKPLKLILATPVGAAPTLDSLEAEADDVVCLERDANLSAIGYYYDDFSQVSDEEVVDVLARRPATR